MDTKIRRTFAASPKAPLAGAVGSAFLAASCCYLAFGTDRVHTKADLAVVCATGALTLFLAVLFAYKAFRAARAAPVVVSPEGIRDLRKSSMFVPWRAIDGIFPTSATIHLKLDPEFEGRPEWIGSLRLASRLGRRAGKTGLHVKSVGLKASFGELLTVTTSYKKVDIDDTPISERRMVAVALPETTFRRLRSVGYRPYAAFALLAILAVVFALECVLAPVGQDATSLSARTLAGYGGMSHRLVDRGDWWRLFTGPLLHGGPGHVFMNGVALFFGGYILESLVGWRWFLVAFAGGALAGGAGSYLLNNPDVVTVGASGGVLGIFAATIVVAFLHTTPHVRSTLVMQSLQVLVPTFLIPLFGDRGGMHVDVAAHAGGALGGVLVGLLIAMFWDAKRVAPKGVAIASLAALAYVGTSIFAVGLAAMSIDDRRALDPDLPSDFRTVVRMAPELAVAHPKDPRIRYALAVKSIEEGNLDEGEALLKQVIEDREAERLWPSIGKTAKEAYAIAEERR